MNSNPWLFFDSIRCINLRTRPDRFRQASEVFDKLSIPVQWFLTDRHPNGGIQGCYESHLACIREAYQRGAKTCLMFEDDVLDSQFARDARLLVEAIQFMDRNQTWDLLYLGTCPDITRFKTEQVRGYPQILKMRSLCTHAYVISRRYMQRLVGSSFVGTPIDYEFLGNPNAYGVYPSIFYQRSSGSDISGDFWNRVPIKHLWFRAIEIYAKYINRPVRSVVRVIAAGTAVFLVLYLINPQLWGWWLCGSVFLVLLTILLL